MKTALIAAAAALTAAHAAGSLVGAILSRRNQARCDALFADSNMLEAEPQGAIHFETSYASRSDLSPENISDCIARQIERIQMYSEYEAVAFDWETLKVKIDTQGTVAHLVTTVEAYDFSDKTFVVMAP